MESKKATISKQLIMNSIDEELGGRLSKYSRAIREDAIDLLDSLDVEELPTDRDDLHDLLLNGAVTGSNTAMEAVPLSTRRILRSIIIPHLMQFHNMNAHITHYDGMEVFTSYKTNILTLYYKSNLIEAGPHFNCSSSTRKQVSIYLRERFGILYKDFKKAAEESAKSNTDIALGDFKIRSTEKAFYNMPPFTYIG